MLDNARAGADASQETTATAIAASMGWRGVAASIKDRSTESHLSASARPAGAKAASDPAAGGAPHDPYSFLDIEPDFAWRSADGRRVFVAHLDEAAPPEWLNRSAQRRKRARVVNVMSWLVTAAVLSGVVVSAGLAMLGSDRFGAAVREVTGFDIDGSAPVSAVAPASSASAARLTPASASPVKTLGHEQPR